MNLSFLRETLYGIGREALAWMPLAIGIATNNPTILTVSELGYAALHLYTAYKSESKVGRLSALSNATISLISPLTYHPALTSHISTTIKAHILIGMGGNNVIRGAFEMTSVMKNVACSAVNKIFGKKENNETKSIRGKIIGNAIRLSLGVFRVYSGKNQINIGLSQLSNQSSKPESNVSQEPPKIDRKHARYEFEPKITATKTISTEKTPKIDPKHARYVFNGSPRAKAGTTHKCFPKFPHPNDIAFYKRASNSANIPSIYSERRCEGTLYLRAEDVNYLSVNDNYVRRPLGEIKKPIVDKLIKDGRVWYRTVEKVRDICTEVETVRTMGGKIKRLILVSHANMNEMLFSLKGRNNEGEQQDVLPSLRFDFSIPSKPSSSLPTFRINTFNQESWSEKNLDSYILDRDVVFPKTGCLNYLEPQAEIILVGCSIGQKTPDGNLADAIARQVPGHKVIAPLSAVKLKELMVRTKNGKPEFYFENSIGSDFTYTAKAQNNKK